MENVSINVNIMRSFIKFVFINIFLFGLCLNVFCQTTDKKDTTPVPYDKDEIPEPLQDLRRFEIITLGSMPFITMDAAMVYNGYKYATGKADTFNPLATADYKPDEMKRIILTSLCISAGIGVSDYVIRLIKRKSSQKKLKQEYSQISIEENPDAVRIPLPQELEQEVEVIEVAE